MPPCTELCWANKVHVVSSPAVAVDDQDLENTYRNINIGLINELAILCNRMGIDLWEVIEAAKTKPFGFTAFYPGPGLGGHCIPLDPYYLTWKAREYGFHTSMIEASMMINDHMPEYTVERCGKILNRHRKALNGSQSAGARRGIQAGYRRLPRESRPACHRGAGENRGVGHLLRPLHPRVPVSRQIA